jgi:diaminopimelate epimerase
VSDFAKYQALGNDYLVVDPHSVDLAPTAENVRLLCDRHYGIGADGVLFGPIGPVARARPVRLRVFNSDGSEAEKSGNGLRMFALYLAEWYGAESELVVRTLSGDSRVVVDDFAAGVVSVDMGQPRFDAVDIPVLGLESPVVARPLHVAGHELAVTCVNIGNPHTVVPMGRISADVAHELGPLVCTDDRFPNGTNVQFMRVLDRAHVAIEIWERGSGYTLASGSSSCAAACAARRLGLVDGVVDVRMPGGHLTVRMAPDGAVTMTGVAEQVATGRFALALRHRLGLPTL